MKNKWNSQFAHTNGIRMHFLELGQGPLVILCHGWPETAYSWRHQIPALAAAGYHVVAPDMRGYGLTDAPADEADYSMADLVADVVGLLQALQSETAAVIGHDFGSVVAAQAALLRPDVFHAVGMFSIPYMARAALSPRAQFETLTQDRHFYQAYFQKPRRIERELEEDVRRTMLGILYSASANRFKDHPESKSTLVSFPKDQRLVDQLFKPDTLPLWLTADDLDTYVSQFERSGFRGGINWYRNLQRNWEEHPFQSGAKITQPALYVAGESDAVLAMAKEHVDALTTMVPRLMRKAIVPGAGHWVQQEKPEEVNQILVEFLRETSAGRR
jgi:pimeloyl-ACP methyl ester carboxylesterase